LIALLGVLVGVFALVLRGAGRATSTLQERVDMSFARAATAIVRRTCAKNHVELVRGPRCRSAELPS
jgi:hypothetical protein